MNYHVSDVGPLAMDARFDLARPRMRIVERARALEAKRQERNEPTVRAKETKRARFGAGRLPDDPPYNRFVGGLLLACLLRLRERLEVSLHAGDLRHRGTDRGLELFGDLVCLFERKVARQLHVQRQLFASVDVDQGEV